MNIIFLSQQIGQQYFQRTGHLVFVDPHRLTVPYIFAVSDWPGSSRSYAIRLVSSPRCWKDSAATMHRSPHWTRYLWLWRERLHHFLSSLELEDLKNKDLNCTLDFLRECVLTRAFWINMYFLEKDIFMHPSPNSKVQSTLALQRRWTTAPAKVQSRNHLLCYRKIGFVLFLFTDRMYC